ncbi:MAG: DoxX family protein [Chitinophagaceae bacterium]|nr:MAG: DoxX family protein [Chitinophagaceae bacterium]
MKLLIPIVRIVVGTLFIFSGLIKANDPMGLSYKMQEFFELWNLSQFNGLSLLISFTLIAFEIVVGVALLIGWKSRLISWILLVLILLFTFLTGYAFLSGKFKNCGCFGDCIPISPLTSFVKDVILLVLISLLFIVSNTIKPLFSKSINVCLLIGTTVGSIWIQLYVLNHLPLFDCLPFKNGNSISEKMKMPANAITDSVVVTFVYDKIGTRVEFTADKFPEDFNDSTYKFVDRYDKLIRKGKNNEPPIKGFSLKTLDNLDVTYEILEKEKPLVLFFSERISKINPSWNKSIAEMQDLLFENDIQMVVVTAESENSNSSKNKFSYIINNPDILVVRCDATAIRTAARINPTMYLLKKGIVEGKWAPTDFEAAKKIILSQRL